MKGAMKLEAKQMAALAMGNTNQLGFKATY